jgi:Sulfotransferase family
MLRAAPLPPLETLTPRAREFAAPELTPAAQAALAKARADESGTALDFSPTALMAAAQHATGLENFGAAPLLEPLTVLCRSLNEELEFHALGRSYVRQQLLGLLTTRLRFEALWARRPEILDLPVERPIIIIGLPRSGTTILHRLLSQDPAKRFSPFWEQVMPLPFGDPEATQPEPDPRRARVAGSIEVVNTIAPDLKNMHELLVDEPDEDLSLLLFAFASMQFEWSYRVPSYSKFYQATDQTEGYRYFKKVLQTLQWLRGGERWVLKAPQHLEQLAPLLTIFPDATLVQTHRDPVPAIISLASLTTYGGRRYYDHPNPIAVGEDIAAIVERLLRKGMEDRPAHDPRFVDIQFADLIANPIGMVRRIYAASGDALSSEAEARMRAWGADNRQEKHGRHDYDAADFGFDLADLRRRVATYQARYDVPTDPRFAG